MQKSLPFLSTNTEQSEKDFKTLSFTIASKNKIFRNKLNQGDERLVQWKVQNVSERN